MQLIIREVERFCNSDPFDQTTRKKFNAVVCGAIDNLCDPQRCLCRIGNPSSVKDNSHSMTLASVTTPHGQDAVLIVWRMLREAKNIRVDECFFVHMLNEKIEVI